MNVDLIRTLDPRNAEPAPGARGDKAGSGFADLMDSMLGGGAGDRAASRGREDDEPARAANVPEARADRGPRPERNDRSDRGARAARSDRSDRSDRADTGMRSARGEKRDEPTGAAREEGAADETVERAAEVGPRAEAPVGAPGRRGAAGRKGEAAPGEDDAYGAPAAQADPAVVTVAASAAVPEWIARAMAPVESGTDILAEEAPSDAGTVEALASAVGAVAAGTASGAADAGLTSGLADAASPGDLASAGAAKDALSDPAVARDVIAALEGVREAGRSGEVSAIRAREASPAESVAGTAAEAAARPVEVASVRAEAPRVEAPRREAEPVVARSTELVAQPELAPAQARTGDEGASQDRPRDPQAGPSPLPGADRLEPASAAASVAAESATSAPDQTLDASGRPQDVAAQARVDGMLLAPTARPTEPLSPMQTGRPMPAAAPEAIAAQADWLATRGGGTARLVLHPQELGEISIRVTVRNQAVDVVMVAHTALAHQVAEEQSDRLSQAFAGRDLRLEQFEVRRGDPSDASSTGHFGSSDAGARERERAQEEAQVGRGGVGQGGRRGAAGVEPVVAPPRIVPSGRAAGIDLRI
ncbi:MAG: flagellar hook-length control protein FliK [Myxococcota bacterium]